MWQSSLQIHRRYVVGREEHFFVTMVLFMFGLPPEAISGICDIFATTKKSVCGTLEKIDSGPIGEVLLSL